MVCIVIHNVLGYLVAREPWGLTGRVTDSSGSSIPEVAIQVRNTATGQATSGATTSDGTFLVTNLSPGRYRVAVSKTGFRKEVFDSMLSAAKRGWPEALHDMGYFYATGKYVMQDRQEAIKFVALAAIQGLDLSLKRMGGYYDDGRVLPYNRDLSQMWSDLGDRRVNSNDPRAQKVISAMMDRLSEEPFLPPGAAFCAESPTSK